MWWRTSSCLCQHHHILFEYAWITCSACANALEAGKQVIFATNDSNYSRRMYVDRWDVLATESRHWGGRQLTDNIRLKQLIVLSKYPQFLRMLELIGAPDAVHNRISFESLIPLWHTYIYTYIFSIQYTVIILYIYTVYIHIFHIFHHVC